MRSPLAIAATLVALLIPAGSSAEDRISLRGAYFREASNRVVQPMLEVTKDLPGGIDVGGRFLVDAITSASVAQGAVADSVFTERRYEGALSVGYTRDQRRIGGFLRYSNEPDYKSYTAGLNLTQEVWERTGTLTLNLAKTYDGIFPVPQTDKDLGTWFAGVAYTQALSPTTIAQGVYETFWQRGFIPNPYLAHGSLGRERVPNRRLRHAFALRLGQFFPRPSFGLQAHYRFYYDQKSLFETGPWGMRAHTLEGRASQIVGRDVEIRLVYRFHTQARARFWCDTRADISCYGMSPEYHSVDIKFGDLRTQLAEAKIIWDLKLLSGTAIDFFSAGSLDVSYGYYFEGLPYGQLFDDRNAPPVIGGFPFTRSHGGAHLIQTGYSLPF